LEKRAAWGDFHAKFSFSVPCFACEIPYSAEQGILLGEQGIFPRRSGNFAKL
jgi:hypothetical protein